MQRLGRGENWIEERKLVKKNVQKCKSKCKMTSKHLQTDLNIGEEGTYQCEVKIDWLHGEVRHSTGRREQNATWGKDAQIKMYVKTCTRWGDTSISIVTSDGANRWLGKCYVFVVVCCGCESAQATNYTVGTSVPVAIVFALVTVKVIHFIFVAFAYVNRTQNKGT